MLSTSWMTSSSMSCFFSRINLSSPSRLRVRVGKYLRNVAEPFEQVLAVEQIIVHCSYNRTTFDNDIALLRVTLGSLIGCWSVMGWQHLGLYQDGY